MTDGAHKKVKLNVRIPPSKKKEWKDALDDGETLTSLVQRAVDKEIRDEYVPIEAIDNVVDTSQSQNVDLSEITGKFEDFERIVSSLERKIDTIAASNDDADEYDIETLAMDLLPRIPSYPRDIPEHALKSMEGKGGMGDQEFIQFIVEASREDPQLSIDGSAQRFSAEIREPTHIVREALIYLESNTTENVKSAIVAGTRHWMQL